MIQRLSVWHVVFTAVKRKKQRHFQFFRALKFESVQTFTSAKFVWKRCLNITRKQISRDKICGCQLIHSEHMLEVKSLSFQKRR